MSGKSSASFPQHFSPKRLRPPTQQELDARVQQNSGQHSIEALEYRARRAAEEADWDRQRRQKAHDREVLAAMQRMQIEAEAAVRCAKPAKLPVRYRSALKRSIHALLVKNGTMNDLEIVCRLGKKFTAAYRNKKTKAGLESTISKVRGDLRTLG